ncbi:MAG: hypothetical protein M3436_00740 [Pseudomonadota bacterium]|nr:hypothetical protein [Pseudomonadota bacterium]
MRPEHPAAAIFPLLIGEEFEDFCADIAEHGLLQPIQLLSDHIIDGRNRYRACIKLGIDPVFEEVDVQMDALAYVVSVNLHRRHLNESQRAMIAAEIANMPAWRPQRSPPIGGLSQPQAARMLAVSERSVQRATKVRKSAAPEVVEAVRSGQLPVSRAADIAEIAPEAQGVALKQKHGVHFSSETPEHYTPKVALDAIISCLGEIDLDPCGNPGEPNVPAHRHYTEADDGLAQDWHGRVFMNPPYGREIGAWVRKLHSEYGEARRVTEAIALVPSRTDTEWFRVLRDYPVCFISGRLTFVGNSDPAPFPSAIFYLGDNLRSFTSSFCGLGDIWARVR